MVANEKRGNLTYSQMNICIYFTVDETIDYEQNNCVPILHYIKSI